MKQISLTNQKMITNLSTYLDNINKNILHEQHTNILCVIPSVLVRLICKFLPKKSVDSLSMTSKKIHKIVFQYKAQHYYLLVNDIFKDEQIKETIMNSPYTNFKKISTGCFDGTEQLICNINNAQKIKLHSAYHDKTIPCNTYENIISVKIHAKFILNAELIRINLYFPNMRKLTIDVSNGEIWFNNVSCIYQNVTTLILKKQTTTRSVAKKFPQLNKLIIGNNIYKSREEIIKAFP